MRAEPGKWLAGCAVLLVACTTQASEQVRIKEIAHCQAGEIVTWPDGRDAPAPHRSLRLLYRHAGAPPWFDEALVLGTVQRAAAAWSACGIPAEVISEAAAPLAPARVLVQWSEAGAHGNFGTADVNARTLSLSAKAFAALAQRNPRHPAAQTLQMVVSHEMGHFYGLMAHSRRCVDVMSYYDNGRGEACFTRDGSSHRQGNKDYRALLPTACDIARCRAVNGIPPAAPAP